MHRAPPVGGRTATWGSIEGRQQAVRSRRQGEPPPLETVVGGRGAAGGDTATRRLCLFGVVTEIARTHNKNNAA